MRMSRLAHCRPVLTRCGNPIRPCLMDRMGRPRHRGDPRLLAHVRDLRVVDRNLAIDRIRGSGQGERRMPHAFPGAGLGRRAGASRRRGAVRSPGTHARPRGRSRRAGGSTGRLGRNHPPAEATGTHVIESSTWAGRRHWIGRVGELQAIAGQQRGIHEHLSGVPRCHDPTFAQDHRPCAQL